MRESKMSIKSEELPRVQNAGDKKKLTCHLVSLPRIILTRIDEGTLSTAKKASPLKKPLKRISMKKIKQQSSSKSSASKLGVEKRPKSRPKPGQNVTVQKAKLKKALKGTLDAKKISTLKKSLKESEKSKSVIKTMLKKTTLQKRSKIAIPSAKKDKVIPTKSIKTTTTKPKKLSSTNKNLKRPPKPKKQISPNILPTKPLDTDTSEDEFLYDELIEELENAPMNQSELLKSVPEKTTNITIKPNVGNKPPTVVKGGIVKKTNLPADLQPIASPNNITTFRGDLESSTKPITDQKKATTRKKKAQDSSDSPVLPKKASPWPVSISTSKPSLEANTKKSKKNAVQKKKSTPNVVINNKSPQTQPKATPQLSPVLTKPVNNIVSKPVSLNVVKPKIGPKQTAKVVPLSKTVAQEDNLSDEYTEEETLENIDPEPLDILSEPGVDPIVSNKSVKENSNTSLKPTLTLSPSKNDEDPHLDLLRILTDDSDEPVTLQPIKSELNVETRTSLESKESHQTQGKILTETTNCDQTNGDTSDTEEEPPARTIYDLMNEVSLQYPSWNLHIIPETNAFCIAQVTKGRLGLPTLKKCIELDPVDYNAKVYIHQYHIKRFDGVYDSEESIVALIQEINSIKA